jgi:hypothetical protein
MTEGPWKGEWVGLGCAACHNGQLEYKGTKIRISGGTANTLDVLAFMAGLDGALAATVTDPEKFGRLAEKLGQKGSADTQALRTRLEQTAAATQPVPEPECPNAGRCRTRPYGCARLDSQPGAIKLAGHP